MLCKLALGCALQTSAAERAVERLRPHQLAIGVPRGVERLIHSCRAAHSLGWLVARHDFANGFNSMDRQCMLNAVAQRFPESMALFNLLYGIDSSVFLMDDATNITVIQSQQGSRQGCAAGTFLFCLGLASVVNQLQELYPELVILSFVDDVVVLVPPPDSNDRGAWEALYRRHACCLADLKRLALGVGLTLNLDKCGLLVPPNRPRPLQLLAPSSLRVSTFRHKGL